MNEVMNFLFYFRLKNNIFHVMSHRFSFVVSFGQSKIEKYIYIYALYKIATNVLRQKKKRNEKRKRQRGTCTAYSYSDMQNSMCSCAVCFIKFITQTHTLFWQVIRKQKKDNASTDYEFWMQLRVHSALLMYLIDF